MENKKTSLAKLVLEGVGGLETNRAKREGSRNSNHNLSLPTREENSSNFVIGNKNQALGVIKEARPEMEASINNYLRHGIEVHLKPERAD